MSRPRGSQQLTTTSYAILGLLAIRPWTAYELATQMERTLNRILPRARSKLYEEPKKLVAHGLADASKDRVGRRPRTVYSITPAGRSVLGEWLTEPAEGVFLESEALVKLFFADHGTKQDALATLDATRGWAAEQLGAFAEAASAYLSGEGPFPERAAVNIVNARFMIDFYETVAGWTEWAASVIAEWPEDSSEAEPDWAVMEENHRRARRSERAIRQSVRAPASG